jgi:hypothetical protein
MTMTVTDSGGSRTHVYTYDNIYQLTEVDYPSGFDYLARSGKGVRMISGLRGGKSGVTS